MKLKKIDNLKYSPFRLSNIYSNIKIPFRNIKYKYQRAKYGVSNLDCWSLDTYFFESFKNGLIILKKDTNGHPIELTPEEWDNVLDKMIELCEKIILNINLDDIDIDELEHYNWRQHQEEYIDMLNEFFDMMKEWIGHLWW